MREALRFRGKVMSATISRVANRWFVSITVDTQDLSHLPQAENQGVVGGYLGVSAFSTGEPPVPGPKPHKMLLKGSRNRQKAKSKLAKLHAMMSNRYLARSKADMSLDVNWSIKHLCEVALLSLQIERMDKSGLPHLSRFDCSPQRSI